MTRARPRPKKREVVRARVVTLGACGAGKSRAVKAAAGTEEGETEPTVGADFCGVRLGGSRRVALFDLSGHEKFWEVRSELYGDAAVLLVADSRRPQHLQQLDELLKEARRHGLAADARMGLLVNDRGGGGSGGGAERARAWASARGVRVVVTAPATDGEAVRALLRGILNGAGVASAPAPAPAPAPTKESVAEEVKEWAKGRDLVGLLALVHGEAPRRGASYAEIQKLYKRALLKIHPDKVSEGDRVRATERFKAVQEAWSRFKKK